LTARSWLRLISGVHLAARDEFQTADKLRIQAAKSVQRSAARTFNQNAAAAMMLVLRPLIILIIARELFAYIFAPAAL
jgi:hypothetical protein